MRKAIMQAVLETARADPALVLLHGDVFQEMGPFKSEFPDRIFNCGICEQSMIGIAAGMAAQGLRPVVYSAAPFLFERAFEQIKLDLDEADLPVVLIGYEYPDVFGPTHHCLNAQWSLNILKRTPTMIPVTPEGAATVFRSACGAGGPSIVVVKK